MNSMECEFFNIMKLSATHAFNCIILVVKFSWTSGEDIPPALHMNVSWLESSKAWHWHFLIYLQQFKEIGNCKA